jgi:hypothetical protein
MSKEDKDIIRRSISKLEDEISMITDEVNIDPENYFPSATDLPGLNMDIVIFDYDGETKKIYEECKETLDCLSSLYLSEDVVNMKNVYNIIQNDAKSLSELKFSLSMSKRGLINLMTQIDAGINQPDMYMAVSTFQKEIRDSIKMLYDIQKRMKDFYKELKNELSEINIGGDEASIKSNPDEPSNEFLSVTDTKLINKIIEEYKENASLLKTPKK